MAGLLAVVGTDGGLTAEIGGRTGDDLPERGPAVGVHAMEESPDGTDLTGSDGTLLNVSNYLGRRKAAVESSPSASPA